MPFNATCITVMIASPGDVDQEREIAHDVIHRWNVVNARERSQVLMPLCWERNAAPSMRDRPQEIINRQVLEKTDILVAIFWTRLGTATGEYASGTVEEIEKHLVAGGHVLPYFSRKSVPQELMDTEQWSAREVFRERLQQRGLYKQFNDADDFHKNLTLHLAQTINDAYPLGAAKASDNAMRGTPELAGLMPEAAATHRPARMSHEAKELLLEAAKDPNGTIARLRHMGGTMIQSNGRMFAVEDDARSVATWEGAITELEVAGLIVDRGYKAEVYGVTAQGYNVADALAKADRESK